MKISEVISQLASYMSTNGDLECFVIADSITMVDGHPKNSHSYMISPVKDILCLKDEKKVASLAISSVPVGAPTKVYDEPIKEEKPKEEDKKETEEENKSEE